VRASASIVAAGGITARSLPHADVSGTTAVEASTASASRRLINEDIKGPLRMMKMSASSFSDQSPSFNVVEFPASRVMTHAIAE
jgi:hypothetical protein